MTTALKGGEGSASRPGRSLPLGRSRYPLYRRLGPGAGLDRCWKSCPPRGFDPRTVQPVVSRHTDWATRPTNWRNNIGKRKVLIVYTHSAWKLFAWRDTKLKFVCRLSRVLKFLCLTELFEWHRSSFVFVFVSLSFCWFILRIFYIHGSVHRDSILVRSNKMQQYAGVYLLQIYSTCFGCLSHPSSGVHKTVTPASGTGHITYLGNNLPPSWPN